LGLNKLNFNQKLRKKTPFDDVKMRIVTFLCKPFGKSVMKRSLRFLVFGLMSCKSMTFVLAQPISPVTAVDQLSNLWIQNAKGMSSSLTNLGLDEVPSLWPDVNSNKPPEILQQIEQYYNQKAKATRADYGLSWNTNIIQNFDPQPTEENLFFKARTTSGFNWDILAGGLVANGIESKALVNEKNIELLSAMENRNQSISYVSKNNILYLFNAQKVDVLEKKKKILQDEIGILKQAVSIYPALNDELYKAYEQLMETNGQIQTYRGFNDGMDGLVQSSAIKTSSSWPLFDINVKALRMLCNNHPVQDRQLMLQEENDAWRKHWVNEVGLSYSFKYNYFDLQDNMKDRAFISMGLNANVPLRIFNKDYHSLSSLKLQKAKSQLQVQTDLKWTQVSALVYEYRYKLKQYAVAVGRQDLLRQQLELYGEQAKVNTEYFQPLEALSGLLNLWNLEIEKLDAQQQLYLKLGDIHGLLPEENVLQYIRPWSPYEEPITFQAEAKLEMGCRGIYVWSKTIAQRESTEITEKMMQWGIQEVYLSLGNDADQVQRFKILANQLQKKDIAVHLLVGRNQWLKVDAVEKLDSVWKKLNGVVLAGVHIDIEPHAMDEYKVNKDSLMQRYTSMVTALHSWSEEKGVKLGYAIPLYYDEKVLNVLKENSDEVVLMAYETSGPEAIKRRSEEEVAILGNKVSIALSAKDYKLRQDLENDIQNITTWLKSGRFFIHDFESYLSTNP
jgi:hypothetical protein